MPILIPLLAGVLLGTAIDLRTYKISSNVFSSENYETKDIGIIAKGYSVADSSADLYVTAMIPADLALHIKANYVDTEGVQRPLSDFLEETIWENNTLIITVGVNYVTGTHDLPDDLRPLKEGTYAAFSAKSTHFVKSLVLGGWFIYVHKLRTDHPRDKERVKNEVMKTVGEAGEFDEEFFNSWRSLTANLEKLDLRGKVHQEFKVYSALPLGDEYLEPSSLLNNVNKFPEEVSKQGKGYGEPVAMRLYPLKDVNSMFEEVEDSRELESDFVRLNEMFDDLRGAQSLMLTWTSSLSFELTEEQNEHVSKLLEDLDKALKVFHDVIRQISFYKAVDKDLINKAFLAYDRTLPVKEGTYHLAYRRLKESIDTKCQDSFHSKVLGQLKLDKEELIGPIEARDGIEGCKKRCLQETRCRSISFGEKLSSFHRETGTWEIRHNICWIHFRSSGTTIFESSSEWIGDVHVYDRKCS